MDNTQRVIFDESPNTGGGTGPLNTQEARETIAMETRCDTPIRADDHWRYGFGQGGGWHGARDGHWFTTIPQPLLLRTPNHPPVE